MKVILSALDVRNELYIQLIKLALRLKKNGQTFPEMLIETTGGDMDERSRWLAIGWSLRGLYDRIDAGKEE